MSVEKLSQTMTNVRQILMFVIVPNLYKMGLNVLFQHNSSVSLRFLFVALMKLNPKNLQQLMIKADGYSKTKELTRESLGTAKRNHFI